MRIGHGLDKDSVRWLAEAVRPGAHAFIELVFGDGRRVRVARGAGEADVRTLLAATKPEGGAYLELVYTK